MLTGDAVLARNGIDLSQTLHYGAAVVGALLVLAVGKLWRRPPAEPSGPIDLARRDGGTPR